MGKQKIYTCWSIRDLNIYPVWQLRIIKTNPPPPVVANNMIQVKIQKNIFGRRIEVFITNDDDNEKRDGIIIDGELQFTTVNISEASKPTIIMNATQFEEFIKQLYDEAEQMGMISRLNSVLRAKDKHIQFAEDLTKSLLTKIPTATGSGK